MTPLASVVPGFDSPGLAVAFAAGAVLLELDDDVEGLAYICATAVCDKARPRTMAMSVAANKDSFVFIR